jgi:hypothetical protein
MIWRSWNGARSRRTVHLQVITVMSGPRKKRKGEGWMFVNMIANVLQHRMQGSENSASSLRCLDNTMTTFDELAICRAVYLRLRWFRLNTILPSPVAEVTRVASQAFPVLRLSTSWDTPNNLR